MEAFGVADIEAAICIRYDPDGTADPDESFLHVDDPEDYQDYVCQMAELVTVKGLPPEIDHHVFELELPGPLPFAWGQLEAMLTNHGDLSINSPQDTWGMMRSMSLHFPEFVGVHIFPPTGAVRDDGPRKLCFFPNGARNRAHVVPVSFPRLDLSVADAAGLSLEDARSRAREWSGCKGSLAELLMEEARRRDPETIFRALSACAEVNLVCGLARALSGAFPGGGVSLELQDLVVSRLYGSVVGERVAAAIRRRVAASLEDPEEPRPGVGRTPLFLDEEVAETTKRVRELLGDRFCRRARMEAEPTEGVGCSLVEVASMLGVKRLLAGRGIDFGLSLAALVPFVDVDSQLDGSCHVGRKYRVSESEKHGRTSPDRQVDNQELAEEVLAYMSRYLSKRSERFDGAHLPVNVATKILAIMQPLLRANHVEIEIRSRKGALRAEVRRGAGAVDLARVHSKAFVLDGDAIVPTRSFHEGREARKLAMNRRGLSVPVEAFLAFVKPLFDHELDEDEREGMLSGAAMCADEALGLTHVQEPLEAALDRLEERLNLVVRGHRHGFEGGSPEVTDLFAAARENLRALSCDWAAPLRGIWSDPDDIELNLLRSMGVPKEELEAVYKIPTALPAAIEASMAMISSLESVSAKLWAGVA
jgi:hypothetical protein